MPEWYAHLHENVKGLDVRDSASVPLLPMPTMKEHNDRLKAKALPGRMLIVEALKAGKTVSQVARENGVTRQRISQIKKWAEKEGLLS